MKIFNTLTGEKEEFKPIAKGEVKMYVCGVTVYDRCHMGHARAGVAFDFIYRSLETLGYKVTYVRNFTDVDDKIINRANERNISCDELVEENIKTFYEDMGALNLKKPTHEPRATQYISQMLKLIEELVDKGLAYESKGDIFYSVRSFPQYGKLSKKNIDDLEEGARVNINEDKRDPLDFALWKKAKDGEPKWESPWGEGRPGWHIECSAMSRELLGNNFDIHGGGKDLVFPHHENEIAQSQGACGCAPVNYWMHNGFVNINKEKMSKSLGNFFTIKDVIAKFDPEAVRLYLVSTHYRSPIDFADEYLAEAERTLDRFYATKLRASKLLPDGETAKADDKLMERFLDTLKDDFNGAMTVALLNEVITSINVCCDKFKKENSGHIKNLASLLSALDEIASVLGILYRDPAEYLESVKDKRLAERGTTREHVEEQIEKRNTAKADKDYVTADKIRDDLRKNGVLLKDSPNETTWVMMTRVSSAMGNGAQSV